ncbi:MAG: AMP-binding protein [Caulobacterales bacterium]
MIEDTNLYPKEYAESIEAPEDFWMRAAREISWSRAPTIACTRNEDGTADWFPDGVLNTCYNALDRHVEAGRGDKIAFVYDSAMTGVVRRFTYRDVLQETARLAGLIASFGVVKGDRVIIYMPAIPESVFAMLACARLGVIHSVVFGGFASAELAKRIDDAKPKLVLSASCGLEPNRVVPYKPLLDEGIELAQHKPSHCIIFQRPQLSAELLPGRDLDWTEALVFAQPAGCVDVAATDPLYVLYTSGTTGIPKGVVHDNGGYAVALNWSIRNVYGVGRDDTWWAASDIGWVVGHSYMVYGPLIYGCTAVLYEGKPVGTPDAGAFWRVIRDHNVKSFFTAPTAIRAIKRDDPDGMFVARDGIGNLRAIFLAGERADPDTIHWAERMLGIPVIDHWWQTELGWPGLAVCYGLGDVATKIGAAGKPVPGFRFAALDEAHQTVPVDSSGDIAIELPLPPGALTGLWRRQEHFRESYLSAHAGYYTTGDSGLVDSAGYVHVMGRIDDIINVAGHRLSTGGIEQIIAAHPNVAECAVIGAADEIKGMLPVALVVLKAGVNREQAIICDEIIERVRRDLGPVAAFKHAAIVQALPKTRSGKILRSALRRMADGEVIAIPPTIEDPSVLESSRAALASIGFAKRVNI